jgi:hypothetical protein
LTVFSSLLASLYAGRTIAISSIGGSSIAGRNYCLCVPVRRLFRK